MLPTDGYAAQGEDKRGQLRVTRKQEGGETTVHHDGRGKGGGSDHRGA